MKTRTSLTGPRGAVACALWLGLAACGEAADAREIRDVREVALAEGEPRLDVASDERLGLRRPTAPASTPASKASAALAWDTPQGWTERAPSSMRTANFHVAGDERAECYLTLLGGDAGGLAANVNRWRSQMSLAPLGAAEIDALDEVEMLAGRAVLVDFTGTWTGMSGGAGAEGYRLVGALLCEPSGSAFLKMVGPAAVVGGEVESFKALARSLRTAEER